MINTNYEKFMNIIPVDKKIKKVLTKIIEKKVDKQSLKMDTKTDSKGYNYIILRKQSKLYSYEPWFFPKENNDSDINFHIYPYKYHDIWTVALLILHNCGSINSYTLPETINILIIDDKCVENIINKFLNPLIKNKTKHSVYYNYVIKELNSNKDLNNESSILYLLVLISNILGYDGLIFNDKIPNGINVYLNKKNYT